MIHIALAVSRPFFVGRSLVSRPFFVGRSLVSRPFVGRSLVGTIFFAQCLPRSSEVAVSALTDGVSTVHSADLISVSVVGLSSEVAVLVVSDHRTAKAAFEVDEFSVQIAACGASSEVSNQPTLSVCELATEVGSPRCPSPTTCDETRGASIVNNGTLNRRDHDSVAASIKDVSLFEVVEFRKGKAHRRQRGLDAEPCISRVSDSYLNDDSIDVRTCHRLNRSLVAHFLGQHLVAPLKTQCATYCNTVAFVHMHHWIPASWFRASVVVRGNAAPNDHNIVGAEVRSIGSVGFRSVAIGVFSNVIPRSFLVTLFTKFSAKPFIAKARLFVGVEAFVKSDFLPNPLQRLLEFSIAAREVVLFNLLGTAPKTNE